MCITTDKEEEAEALRIQKELYSKVNEEDYKDEFEDSFENAQKGQTLAARKGTMKSLDLSENVNKQELKMDVKDLNGVSDQAKLELLSQLYPDVMAMASQLEEIWSDIQEIQLRSPNMDMESKNPKLGTFYNFERVFNNSYSDYVLNSTLINLCDINEHVCLHALSIEALASSRESPVDPFASQNTGASQLCT